MTEKLSGESSNKVKEIQGILGRGWTVAFSVGHIRSLPHDEMGLKALDFASRYVSTHRGADVIKQLRGLAAKPDEIYLATDPDRDGEATNCKGAMDDKCRKPSAIERDITWIRRNKTKPTRSRNVGSCSATKHRPPCKSFYFFNFVNLMF